MDYISSADKSINSILVKYAKKPTIIRGVIHLLLVLYAVRLAPQVPDPVSKLFENSYFRLFIFSMVFWTAQFSPSTSILIAISFLVTMNYVNKRIFWEFMENATSEQTLAASEEEQALAASEEEQALAASEEEQAPATTEEAPAPAPVKEEAQTGCYPMRLYDASQVMPFDSSDMYNKLS
jgi:hypothetical protein